MVNQATMGGWLARKVKWGVQGRRSAMDHVFVKDGRTVWMEFKRPGVVVDPDSLQGREHARFRKAGAEVYVVNSVAQGRRILGL